MSDLLEYAGEPSKIIFNGKVTDFQFTENIGDIEIYNNSIKRDKALLRLGKKIISIPLLNRLRFEIWKHRKWRYILTDEEIAELMCAIEK